MIHTRRALLGGTAAALAAPALAQGGFPDKPLRCIVPYPPGGVTDILTRVLAEPLGRALGQAVVVENRAGAGGNIGVLAALAAEPDGYTLLHVTAAIYGVNPVLYAGNTPDPLRDMTCLGTIAVMANVLSVNPARLDVRDVAGLVERGRRGGLVYGSVGNGSSSHLCASEFLRRTGLEATHVPYRGSSPAVAALLAREVDFLFDVTTTSTAHIRSGAFRALAVTTPDRAAALPEVPTLQELGFADYSLGSWSATCCSARVPAAVQARLRQAHAAALGDPAMPARLDSVFVDPLRVPDADLPAWLAAESARWGRVAREARLQLG